MSSYLVSLFLSLFAWAENCPQLLFKLRDQDMVKVSTEIRELELHYSYLDKLWDQFDTQARFQEKMDTTAEMEIIAKKLNNLLAQKKQHYLNLSERIRLRKELDALDKEWDRIDSLGNQNVVQKQISDQIEDLSEQLKLID